MTPEIYTNVTILDAGSEGKAVARVNDLVIFVPFVVPGDVVDIRVTRRKRNFLEGKAIKFHHYSEKRAEAFCEHFGTCGGCRWQNMGYEGQLFYKQKQVVDALQRIAGIEDPGVSPILPAAKTKYYRNKLEFTFSNRRWLLDPDKETEREAHEMNALGFHLPTFFDRVLDINNCYLQREPSNSIRREVKKYALEHQLTFYDPRTWQGFLRNLLIRTSENGGVMVILVFRTDEPEEIRSMLDHLAAAFPEITSLYYVINPKKNDVINDLELILYKGDPWITETFPAYRSGRMLEFRIGPVSFFQTNTPQAVELYRTAADFAGLEGFETVYDLYTGIGTIASFIAGSAGKVIGIDSVPAAVNDARENAVHNGIRNVVFHAGELEKMLDREFVRENGVPDLVITDPPRSGMHARVTREILAMAPPRIVYVSCNPATQARDILLMKEQYELVKCQPVDMFPHTQHVENVALLVRKDATGNGPR